MAETIDELNWDYEDEGKLVRRTVKKEILTKGAWVTAMFLFEELDKKTEVWGAPKVSIVRFKKQNGVFRKQSSFNISSKKQAEQIISVMQTWYAGMDGEGETAQGDD